MRSRSAPLRASLAACAVAAVVPPAAAAGAYVDDADGGSARANASPGPEIVLAERPRLPAELRACSFREPLCVHASARAEPASVARALGATERAWEAAAWGLRLPPPDRDPETGMLDVYLTEGVPFGGRAELAARDPISSFDRASAFLRVDEALAGCALEAVLSREIARAILLRAAPATDPVTATAEVSYLARLMAPCASGWPGGVDVYQAHPEVSVAGALEPGPRSEPSAALDEEYAAGASLFYWWLDDAFGNAPGDIVRALWALAPTATPSGASRWAGQPDGFDVLRTTFKGALTSGSTFDDLLLEFATARAFVGSRSDAEHMPETRALGSAGLPRMDWAIAWPTAPRRLASARGVEPTGVAYIEVSCEGAPSGARLRFEADWEEHAKMRWAAVKVDAAGHELSAIAIASPDLGTAARFTLVGLEGVARVLFVGASTGDPSLPFDPDDRVPEPHGWIASLVGEPP